MNQSREAHLTARPLHSPRGGHTARDAPKPRATVHEATRRSPCHGLEPTQRPTRSHARVHMTLPPAATAGTTLRARGTSNVLSYRDAPSPLRAIPETPRPKLLVSRSISALTRADPSHPIPLRMWSAATASDGDSPAFP